MGRFDMRQRLISAAIVLVLIGIGAGAAWEETDWGHEIVVDAATGLPAIVFFAEFEADEVSSGVPISTAWEVFAVVGGNEVPLGGASRTAIRSGETTALYAASPAVVIEAGGRYGARLTILQPGGSPIVARTFDVVAPDALPFGIRLTGWDGSETVDLSRLPDEELEELVLLHDLLKRYTEDAEDVEVGAFLRGEATTSDYPLSLLVLPTAEIDASEAPIALFVILNLYVYTLSDPAEAAGVRAQLGQFEQELIGSVYTGPGSTILGGGVTIFVQEAVWPVLEAAAAELATR
jgi:hypothetical protein